MNTSIDDLSRLRRQYGRGRWRKLKGRATVRLMDDTICSAELHWYEANGIGTAGGKSKSSVSCDKRKEITYGKRS